MSVVARRQVRAFVNSHGSAHRQFNPQLKLRVFLPKLYKNDISNILDSLILNNKKEAIDVA